MHSMYLEWLQIANPAADHFLADGMRLSHSHAVPPSLSFSLSLGEPKPQSSYVQTPQTPVSQSHNQILFNPHQPADLGYTEFSPISTILLV